MNFTTLDTRRCMIVLLALAACLWMCTSMAVAQGAATFQGLGDLPGGAFQSVARGVSAAGTVVVGQGFSASGTEAFRWTQAGGMVGLGDLPGGIFQSLALDVSADGSTVVGRGLSGGTEAFRWTQASGMVGLGDLPGGFASSQAHGISGDGSVVVGGAGANGDEAFRWTQAGGMAGLGDLPGGSFSSQAFGHSADASVIVGDGSNASGTEAFRWTQAGGMVGLGGLPGGIFNSGARGVSSDGSVVVGFSINGSGTEAFRWTQAGGMVGLGDLPGGQFFSAAEGVSADGSVVVGVGSNGSGAVAFIWTVADGMRSLRDVLVQQGVNMTGWTLRYAQAVSADGLVIVGKGINPLGQSEGWIATLPGPDTDGDGLLNSWETQGQGMDLNSDGVIDLDLYALGARPNHKDLFVEIDYMPGLIPVDLTPVVTAFANAPVSNPDGVTGINLHLQIDDDTLPVSEGWTALNTFTTVDSLKLQYFGTAAQRVSPNSVNILAAKRKAYRYCIYAGSSDGYAAGVARDFHADDFVVFQLSILNSVTVNVAHHERAVFMHELGHALGLRHGGGDDIFNKPNYISVMNYLVVHPYDIQGWALDFSRGGMLPITENNIDEAVFLTDPSGHNHGRLTFRPNAAALCPSPPCDPVPAAAVFLLGYTIGSQPKDLNGDLQITSGICMDLNYHGTGAPALQHGGTPTPCDIMNDHNDWAALQYVLVDAMTEDGGPSTNPPVELTIAEIQALQAFLPGPPCLADIDESGAVDVDDLIAVILNWGPCPALPSMCTADIAPLPVNGAVDVDDLIAVILNWGDCR